MIDLTRRHEALAGRCRGVSLPRRSRPLRASPRWAIWQVVARVLATVPADLAVTTITLGKQVQGRLAVIRQARSQPDAARGYLRLRETVEFYQAIQLVDYTTAAIYHFEELCCQSIRIGTQDLRIAAIALAEGSIPVSRNTRDFAQMPGLTLEDWAS